MEEDPTVEDAALVAPRVTRKGRDGAAGFTIVEGSGGGAVGGVVRFTALQLSAGRTYKFWVAAHSPLAGWGGWSTPHAFVAGQPTEIPAQPAPPTVSRVDCTSVQLELPLPTPGCAGRDSFRVQYREVSSVDIGPPGDAWKTAEHEAAAGSRVIIGGLAPLRTHHFRLYARNTLRDSAPTEPSAPYLAGIRCDVPRSSRVTVCASFSFSACWC